MELLCFLRIDFLFERQGSTSFQQVQQLQLQPDYEDKFLVFLTQATLNPGYLRLHRLPSPR